MIKPSDSKLDLGFYTTMQRSFLASDDQPNSMWYLKELKVCITFYVLCVCTSPYHNALKPKGC